MTERVIPAQEKKVKPKVTIPHKEAEDTESHTKNPHWEFLRDTLSGKNPEVAKMPEELQEVAVYNELNNYMFIHENDPDRNILLNSFRIAMRNEQSPKRMGIAITVWAEHEVTDPIITHEIGLLESFPLSNEEHIRPAIDSYKQMLAAIGKQK